MGKKLEIVMVGSRGVGKSSTLSAMWHKLDEINTDTIGVKLSPKTETFKSMNQKWQEMLDSLANAFPFGSLEDVSGLTGTTGFIDYDFEFTAGKDKQPICFVDTAGAYTSDLNDNLLERVKNAFGVFYVIDASILMECNAAINNKSNNPHVFKQILDGIDDKQKPAFILFVLTKCETYMADSGTRNQLYQRFNDIYGFVVNTIKVKGIPVYYLPVQTIGGIKFSRLSEEGYPMFVRTTGKLVPVDATYPLILVFEHLLERMNDGGFFRWLAELLGIKEDLQKYLDKLKNNTSYTKPLDFKEL